MASELSLYIDLDTGKQAPCKKSEIFSDIMIVQLESGVQDSPVATEEGSSLNSVVEELSCAPLEQDKQQASKILLMMLCSLSAVEGADIALLPAVFFALQRDLKLELGSLVTIALAQGVMMSAAAPFWGILADRGVLQRKTILSIGCTMQGVVTMSLAFVEGFAVMICLRVFNGIMLASLRPVANGIVADVTPECKRGTAFGFVQLSTMVGMMLGGLIGTPLSTRQELGFQGWRLAFLLAGGMSAILGIFIYFMMKEPTRGALIVSSSSRSAVREEAQKLLSYLRTPTFCALIFQGWFSGVPWKAMSYATLFFQVGGISDSYAAIIAAFGLIMGAIGCSLGGMIGDRMSRAMPSHGRPLTAQISVMAGIPLAYIIFMVDPPSNKVARFVFYLSLVIFLGLTASWSIAGVKLPMLTEIVRPEGRSTILAWEGALESTFSTLLGNALVGFLAQMFGYELKAIRGAVADSANQKALGKALTLTCVVSWLICLIASSLLHWTYPADLRRVKKIAV